jgi:hydrogenase nickel incorporation protein HypA/HybF
MHELSVRQAALEQIKASACQGHARLATRIRVQLGPLSGVEPFLLKQASPLAGAGSFAEGTELILEDLPAQVHCEQRGSETRAEVNRLLLCGRCRDSHTRLAGTTPGCGRAWNSRNVAANRHCQVVE